MEKRSKLYALNIEKENIPDTTRHDRGFPISSFLSSLLLLFSSWIIHFFFFFFSFFPETRVNKKGGKVELKILQFGICEQSSSR